MTDKDDKEIPSTAEEILQVCTLDLKNKLYEIADMIASADDKYENDSEPVRILTVSVGQALGLFLKGITPNEKAQDELLQLMIFNTAQTIKTLNNLEKDEGPKIITTSTKK